MEALPFPPKRLFLCLLRITKNLFTFTLLLCPRRSVLDTVLSTTQDGSQGQTPCCSSLMQVFETSTLFLVNALW